MPVRLARAFRLLALLLAGLAGLAGSAAVSGCRPRARASDNGLVVGRAVDVLGLDPARVTDAESAEVTEQIFDHLVRHRKDSLEIEPALATSWEVSDEGRIWTFHLRDGVKFHDGTPFDADAVIFSFDRQRDPNHPQHLPDFIYWETSYRYLQSIEKVDRLTVRMHLERPYAPFLASLAIFPVSMVSPTAVRRWGADFNRHPVGTGPFRFVEWQPGERVTLEANPDYWDGPPKLKHLVFSVVRDAKQRLVALEGETLDVAENLAPEDLQFVQLHPRLEVVRGAGSNVGYLAMNTQRQPFDDVRVRKAVAHAINRTAIVKLVYQGLAREAQSGVPPTLWSHAAQPQPKFDPAEARRLLREAGLGESMPRLKLYTFDSPRAYLPAPDLVARMIQANLREVGIDVEIVRQDVASHLRDTQAGKHDLCLLGWVADVGDPDNFLYLLFDSDNAEVGSARNVAFYKNAELHGLLRWAQESGDRAERTRLYTRAQEIIAREVPWVPLAHADVAIAARSSVTGLHVHPSATVYFRDVEVH